MKAWLPGLNLGERQRGQTPEPFPGLSCNCYHHPLWSTLTRPPYSHFSGVSPGIPMIFSSPRLVHFLKHSFVPAISKLGVLP